jgi:aryl-alcohol dehydrogenase-like predicted oxidoreductase
VDVIDTADSYGPNVSEEIIAEALSPYPGQLLIATKAGLVRTGPDEWYSVGRPMYLRQQAELSLRRLKLDRRNRHRADLYNLTNRTSVAVLEYATAEGIGFIPWFPVAAGDLAKPGGTGGSRRSGHRRNTITGGARLAAGAVADRVADPRHIKGCPPRGEHRRGRTQVHARPGGRTQRRQLVRAVTQNTRTS